MIKLYLFEDTIKLCFIPFALKKNTKKWSYNITTDSVTYWNKLYNISYKVLSDP